MALIDKLNAIANAVRSKTGGTSKLSLDAMATAISNLKTTFSTQTKSVDITSNGTTTINKDSNYDGMTKVTVNVDVPAPTPSYDTPSISVSSGGLITASANGKSNTKQLTTQAAKTVTPTKSSQTAVSSGVYTTGVVTVGAIPSEYIIPSGSETKTQNGTYDVTSLAELVVNVAGGGGGLPTGIKSIAYGKATISQTSGGSTFTVNHNLGEVPDMFLFYAPSNIATTYSMMFVARSSKFAYRGSTYVNICGYHGNSTTTMTYTNVTTSYGVKSLTATQATITTYSTSTSYYWRAGTYEFIAVKFS